MIEEVKLSLRIKSHAFDVEIQDLIKACKIDLAQSGVSSQKAEDENDPLIKRAITVYCKAHFGYDNPDADRFNHSYQMLKQHLTLAGDYHA